MFRIPIQKKQTCPTPCNPSMMVSGNAWKSGNLNFSTTRIIYLNLLVTCFLVYNYYTASIASSRMTKQIFKINDSLHELSKLGLKMASEPMSTTDVEKSWETEMLYNNSWKSIPDEERFIPAGQGWKKVQNGDFAYNTHPDIGYSIISRTFTNQEICARFICKTH